MKKQFLFAVAATMLTACINTDNLRDISPYQNGESDGSIGFSSYTEKITKGTAENSEALYTWTFYNHQESFQVWGRKSSQPTHEIFGGTKVTVAPATGEGYTYTYSPARFWDKSAASYYFYAAAPAQPDGDNPAWKWTFNQNEITDASTLNKGYFTTSSTLNGVNLQSVTNGGATSNLKNIFKGATLADGSTKDIDKLIADKCPVEQTYYNKAVPNAVNLNFIHILSKLNITISTSLFDANNQYDVDLLAFEVHNIPHAGNFNESTDIPAGKKAIRWTRDGTSTTDILTGIIVDANNNIDTHIDVTAPTAINTPGAKTYIVESLIMPQEIDYERIALDAQEHAAITAAAVPFANYEEYTQAKHDDVTRLSKAQFDALIISGAFVSWNNYNHNAVEGETNNEINQATFNARVAEATQTGSTPYQTYTDYTTAKGENATLTQAQFEALIDNGAFVDWSNYTQIASETDNTISENTFNDRIKEVTRVEAINILKYETPTKPYFTIKYSIDGDIFTQNFNLAAAFLGYTNNSQKKDDNGDFVDLTGNDPTKFGFYEGWQNTLNIVINPTEITFTADVAKWANIEEKEYEIERGNN